MSVDSYGEPEWLKCITPEFLRFLKEKAGQVDESIKIPSPPTIDLIKYRELAILVTQRIIYDNHSNSN